MELRLLVTCVTLSCVWNKLLPRGEGVGNVFFLKALNSASRGDASHCRIWIGRIFTELLFDSVVTFLPTPATPPTGCRSAFSSVKESSGRPLCDATIAAIFISCTAALTRCLLLYRLNSAHLHIIGRTTTTIRTAHLGGLLMVSH